MEMLVVVVILAAVAALVVSNVDGVTDDAEVVAARTTMQTILEAITGSTAAPGYLADMKYFPGFRSVDLRLHNLLSDEGAPKFDPMTRRGWRGPYLRNFQGVANADPARNGRFPASYERRFPGDLTFRERGFFYDASNSYYGLTDDLAVADSWGNPIVVQVPPPAAFNNSTGEVKRFRYARLVSAGPDGILSTPFDSRLAGTKKTRGDDLVLFLNRADIDDEPEEP